MKASANLMFDFDTEVNTSCVTDSFILISGAYKNSTVNTTTVGYYFETPTLTDQAREMVSKIKSFASLEHNWDSYGAIPPSVDNINRAISFIKKADKNLLPFYFAAPGPNGELAIEFRNDKKEASVYINPDSSSELILNEGGNIILEGSLEENYKHLLTFING